MIKLLWVKIVNSVRSDAWFSDAVCFKAAYRWCVDGGVYWLELAVGDVWTVRYTGWNKL